MNDLTPHPQSALPERATMPELSTGLSLLLTHESRPEAASQIRNSPALYAETKAKLPALEAAMWDAMRKARPADVARIVGKRLTVYPQPDRSEDEWAEWWENYYDVCAGLPVVALERAMLDWVKSPAQFLPKPGELRAAAETTLVPEYRAWAIAKSATEKPPMTFTPDEVAERRALVADTLAGLFKKPDDAA